MTNTKEENKALCERFPFLIPSNRRTGKKITEAQDWIPEYDYEYTELDDMPDGWRIAFGEQLCEELKDVLMRDECLDEYRITQIKEKFGSLRWYDFGNTYDGYKIISKYENLSRKTCIVCGKPATRITTGWISPYCDDCVGEERSIPIEEFYDDI